MPLSSQTSYVHLALARPRHPALAENDPYAVQALLKLSCSFFSRSVGPEIAAA